METLALDSAIAKLYKNLPAEHADALPRRAAARMIADYTGLDATALKNRLKEIKKYRAQLARLRAIPTMEQRSPEWYAARQNMLTASDTAQALGRGKFGTRAQLLQKKRDERAGVAAPFKMLPPLKWGIMFEEMAARCYQSVRDGIQIHEFGLIPDPCGLPYGASPDGITDLGIMIEIKCPYRRKIDGTIPEQYQIQMQGQMYVCGLKECDYIECDMQVYTDRAEFERDTAAANPATFGLILEYAGTGPDAPPPKYIYSPPGSAKSLYEWAACHQETAPPSKTHLWRLRYMNIERVYFNEEKFHTDYKDHIIKFWAETCDPVRLSPAAPAPSSKKKKIYNFIDDSD